MITKQTVLTVVVALGAALCAVVGAQAQGLGQHPAVRAQNAAQGIDPNTFIVAHPAQLALRAGHAGHEHPALVAWRSANPGRVDANTFLVQPPASTTWAHEAAPAVLLAVTGKQ